MNQPDIQSNYFDKSIIPHLFGRFLKPGESLPDLIGFLSEKMNQ